MGLDSLAGTSYSANHTLVPTVIACDTTHLPRIPGYFHLGARWKNRRRSVTCLPAETAYSVEMIGPAAEPLLMTVPLQWRRWGGWKHDPPPPQPWALRTQRLISPSNYRGWGGGYKLRAISR